MRKPPSVVQLPGGIRLHGIPFEIVERHEDGSPKTFRILSRGSTPSGDDGCWLFADETWIRKAKS